MNLFHDPNIQKPQQPRRLVSLLAESARLERKRKIDPRALKFRKYLTLQRSEMDLLYSFQINPITMRNAIKTCLKTRPIDFKTNQLYWPAHAGYICSHIRCIIREEDKDQYAQYVQKTMDKKRLNNFLKRCKNLESLKLDSKKDSSILLRNIRYLYQLKSLHLVLDDDQIQKSPNIMRNLNCLRYLSIKIESWQNSASRQIPRFCEHLVKLQHLEKIELDLQELRNPEDVHLFMSLLQHIGKANVGFNIKLSITSILLKTDYIKSMLAKADALVISMKKPETNSKVEYERSRIIRQGYRVLHFIFKEGQDLSFITGCSSLQTLWIEGKGYQSLILEQYSFPKALKNLFVVFQSLASKVAANILPSLILAFEHVETLEKLFFVDQTDQLQDLKCVRNSTKYDLTVCNTPGFVINRTALNGLCSPITTMTSLKSLKLDFERSLTAPVELIQRLVDSLPNTLEQFELVISDYSCPANRTFDLHFPFEALSRLTEFRLDLCKPLSPSAIRHFTKEFVKELEVMIVGGACFEDQEFKIQEILDGLKQMAKIRDLQALTRGKELFRFKKSTQGTETRGIDRENWRIKRFRNL